MVLCPECETIWTSKKKKSTREKLFLAPNAAPTLKSLPPVRSN